MPSSLPTESTIGKRVDDFGIGMYDSDNDDDYAAVDSPKQSVPTEHVSPKKPNDFQSYPSSTAAGSKLPTDERNPSARMDYFDKMTMGQEALFDYLAPDNGGAIYSLDGESIPGVKKNEVSFDNFLSALGNYWSGVVVNDDSDMYGFPTKNFSENVNYIEGDHGGQIIASDIYKDNFYKMDRFATDFDKVDELTKKFIKEFGKKDLTKRHVLLFLKNGGEPQYLSSDIIRCLKHRHDIFVKDVLDEFMLAKISSVRNKFIGMEISSLGQPDKSHGLRRVAATLSEVLVSLERLKGNV